MELREGVPCLYPSCHEHEDRISTRMRQYQDLARERVPVRRKLADAIKCESHREIGCPPIDAVHRGKLSFVTVAASCASVYSCSLLLVDVIQ